MKSRVDHKSFSTFPDEAVFEAPLAGFARGSAGLFLRVELFSFVETEPDGLVLFLGGVAPSDSSSSADSCTMWTT